MGDGNDTFVWDPGDGSDIVEGQDGVDTLLFNGSAGAEIFTASSNGGRLLFTRNVGNIVMDTDDVEMLDLNALGGTDTATVNDLAATDVTNVNIDLGVGGAGDGAVDAVTVNGTVGVDVMSLSGSAGSVTVASTAFAISVTNAAARERHPHGQHLAGGDDLLSASGLASTSVLLDAQRRGRQRHPRRQRGRRHDQRRRRRPITPTAAPESTAPWAARRPSTFPRGLRLSSAAVYPPQP